MEKDIDDILILEQKKILLKTEIKTLKNQLQLDIHDKIELLKSVLRLKNEKKKLERDIQDINNTEILLQFDRIDSETLENMNKFANYLESLYNTTEYIKENRVNQYNGMEIKLKEDLNKLQSMFDSEFSLINEEKSKINEQLLLSNTKNLSLIKDLSNLETERNALSKELLAKNEILTRLKKNYEKIQGEKKKKLYDLHSKLNSEQEAALDINEKIRELEYN